MDLGHDVLTDLRECARIDDVMEKLDAKFTVEKKKLACMGNVPVPGYVATVRTDTKKVLGVVGSKYGVVQYSDAFAFFDTLVEEKQAEYTNGALCRNGSLLVVQAKVNGTREVRRGDGVDRFITLCAGHDGRHPVKAWFTSLRLWCTNQISRVLSNCQNAVSVRHTAQVTSRMTEAFRVMGLANEYHKRFFEVCERLTQVRLTSEMVDNLLLEVCGASERKDVTERKEEIKGLIYAGKGNTGESLWDAYNGVAEYADWKRVPEDQGERRLLVSLFDKGVKTVAWNWALQTANLGELVRA